MLIIRIDKINYYLNIAEEVAKRSTCLKTWYGSVAVLDDRLVSTGYNGAVRGAKNCCDIGKCLRKELNIPSGTQYELCRSLHSEQNCIINAKTDLKGATLYLVGIDTDTGEIKSDSECCLLCKRFLRNAGIEKVVIRRTKNGYGIQDVKDWDL